MCGRFALAAVSGFYSRFHVSNVDFRLDPRYNIAPTQTVPVIVNGGENKVVPMRWGLIPVWAKAEDIGDRLINARAETVATKPIFKRLLGSRRCIVPTTGFYEWKKEGSSKTPYYIRTKGEELFGLAGLYDRWRDKEGNETLSFTIITTEANSFMSKIHNRMPVILREEHEPFWLGKDALTEKQLRRVLSPYPSSGMRAHEVMKAVGNPKLDRPEVTRPLGKQS